METENITKIIKEIRKKHNLTQNDLANKLGVTYQAVSKWENGKSIPDIGILNQISKEFNVDLELLLNGKKNKRFNYKYLIIIGCLILLIILYFIVKPSDNFEVKMLSSSCDNFELSGITAYNSKNASIYISNINYCGKTDNTIYSEISSSLVESYGDINKEIANFKVVKNTSIMDYLKDLKINVDEYKSICNKFNESSIYLEIDASDKNNNIVTYKVPLSIDNSCNK